MVPAARALISVSDKTGIVEFARALHELGIEVLSTGGTAKRLGDAGVPVVEVSSYTGFPEIMDGRVKTLHPKIHGGLLARRDTDADTMREHGIVGIDLLVVNLYPFERAAAEPDCSLAAAIEHIDVGGPAMLRAAAKNHAWVTAIVDADDYAMVLGELRAGGTVAPATRFRLAVKAFEHTARYDGAIANYLGARGGTDAPSAAFPPRPEPPVRESAGDALRRESASARGVLRRAGRRGGRCRGGCRGELRSGRGGERRDGEAAPGQGAVVQQRGRYRRRPRMREELRGACLRDRQACEPLRGGDRERHSPCVRSCVRHRPDLRVRRHHRVQPPARCGDRGGHRRAAVRRGRHRPPHRSRGARAARGQGERPGAGVRCAPGRAARRARFQAGHRRAAGAGSRYRRPHRGGIRRS